jgi:predicted TIM-barrel fold metal-dependent hydrolase
VEFARQLPKDKIVFGTDSPPNEPGLWLRELEVLCHEPPQGMNLSEDDLEGYLGNNIARLVGIDPTPPPRDIADAEARLKDTYAGVDRDRVPA